MFRRISDKMFGLRKIGKYLTDGDLRKAYKDYKQSEEIAARLILNTILSEGWLGFLSQPRNLEEIAEEFSYSNLNLLHQILNFLERSDYLEIIDGNFLIKTISTVSIAPSELGTILANFYLDCSNFLPKALRNEHLPLEEVPRIVLVSVFGDSLLQIGREVLLRNFVPGQPKNVGVAAFGDVGLIFAVQQIEQLFGPEQIHVFVHNYRWASSFLSLLRLYSSSDIMKKVSVHLWGTSIIESELKGNIDLFFGEEFFAFAPEELDKKSKIIADYLMPGARIITDDPTIEEDSEITASYILMQCIKGYPQPVSRSLLRDTFETSGLKLLTLGDNWLVAEKESE
ncbi:MAG: hypothetical protein ACXAB4_11885 [Candidatus Hodarchaeales archaeon]